MNTLLASLHRACTRKKGAAPFAGVLCFVFLVATNGLFAQEPIALVNPSFEQPGVQTINWAEIPGWNMDIAAVNSGVGNNPGIATDGVWIAWLMSDDSTLWQLTEYTIQEGDLITLKADIRNSWQTTVFDLMLYYDDNGIRVPVATLTPDFEGFVDPSLTEFTVTFLAASAPASVGHLLGVAVDNISGTNSFIEMDNFRLSRTTASLESITLINPSFEQPGVQTINWAEIPGWNIDVAAVNSGVGNNPGIATDGVWIAWLMSDDSTLWQLTEYTIQEGDVIALQADVRNSWQTTVFDLMLYYDDNGARVPVAKLTPDFEGFVDPSLTEFTVTFSAANAPQAVGHLLGVAVDNTSGTNSFIEMDNFRLSKVLTTSVERIEELPNSFALEQNYPNPFWSEATSRFAGNPETLIQYDLEKDGKVQLDVYDLLGHKVRTLVDFSQPVGTHSVRWNALDDTGNRVPSGVYIYKLSVLTKDARTLYTMSRKMLLIK
jgi:hypothetical protein